MSQKAILLYMLMQLRRQDMRFLSPSWRILHLKTYYLRPKRSLGSIILWVDWTSLAGKRSPLVLLVNYKSMHGMSIRNDWVQRIPTLTILDSWHHCKFWIASDRALHNMKRNFVLLVNIEVFFPYISWVSTFYSGSLIKLWIKSNTPAVTSILWTWMEPWVEMDHSNVCFSMFQMLHQPISLYKYKLTVHKVIIKLNPTSSLFPSGSFKFLTCLERNIVSISNLILS